MTELQTREELLLRQKQQAAYLQLQGLRRDAGRVASARCQVLGAGRLCTVASPTHGTVPWCTQISWQIGSHLVLPCFVSLSQPVLCCSRLKRKVRGKSRHQQPSQVPCRAWHSFVRILGIKFANLPSLAVSIMKHSLQIAFYQTPEISICQQALRIVGGST